MSTHREFALPDWLDNRNRNVLNQWATWMASGSRSQITINERTRFIVKCAEASNVQPVDMQATEMLAYLSRKNLSAHTRATYIYHLRAWSRFLNIMEIRNDDPTLKLPMPRVGYGEPRPITDADLRKVLSSNIKLRTYAMIILGAFQGFRAHEIAQVRTEDIDFNAWTIKVEGKGRKRAVLPLSPEVAQLAKRMPTEGYWFPAGDRESTKPDEPDHVFANSVSRIVSEATRRAGVNATCHQLRHWFATTLLRNGTDLRTLQELMRHTNLSTTAIYTKVDDSRRREAINKLANHNLNSPDPGPQPGTQYPSATILRFNKRRTG